MKRVRVLIPFTDRVTKELRKENDETELTEERIAEIRAVNVNMISVLGEAEEKPKKSTRSKKKAE